MLALSCLGGATYDMIEDHHFLCAGSFLEQLFDLRVVHRPHFLLVIKVFYLAVLVREHEPVLVQGQLAEDGPCVADSDSSRDVAPGSWQCTRRWRVSIRHRPFYAIGQIVERGLHLSGTLLCVIVHTLPPLQKITSSVFSLSPWL